jgi:hypothetical protein
MTVPIVDAPEAGWWVVPAWDGRGWFVQWDPAHELLPEDVQADDLEVLTALLRYFSEPEPIR